ncbi:MAG TPA: hypothetical protein VGD27_13445 [Longimicrobiales bacterium]
MKGKAAFALTILFATAMAAPAQNIRVNGLTTARYIELRPLTTQETVSMVPFTQDLHVNIWGLGTGIRIYSEMRVRASAGEETDLWPQSDDQFDLLAAFAEIDRTRFRARVGRQWKTSALGFYNFDGLSLLVRPARIVTAELYGGWSLLPGESDDLTDGAIAGIEPYAPDIARHLIGGEIKLRPGPRAAMSALYQREIRTDGAALHAERAAADVSLRPGRFTIEGGIEGDLANEVVNEARMRLSMPVARTVTTSLEARRYRPYFELWTIWGAFNPIGFAEALATAQWQAPSGNTSLRIGGGVRSYRDDNGGVEFDRLRDDGWRVLADAAWTPVKLVTLNGGYRADIGFGASRSQGDIGARLNLGESSYVGASAVAFQMINELQISDGTVYGLGTDGMFSLPGATRLGWHFAVYRHDNRLPTTSTDWSQLRGSVFVAWTVGSNPDGKRLAEAK